jgi:uncharacterized protein
MKISVDEIPQSPKEIQFSESIEELNEVYRQSNDCEFSFPPKLAVELAYYRSGQDIVFHGRFNGEVGARCGRCLEDYRFAMDNHFDFVLTPDQTKFGRRAEELSRGDLGLSYYSGEEIDLAPLIAEQVILALPTRPLCRESCRGLCGTCGTNLNNESCSCSAAAGDPRMAIFRTLKVGR